MDVHLTIKIDILLFQLPSAKNSTSIAQWGTASIKIDGLLSDAGIYR